MSPSFDAIILAQTVAAALFVFALWPLGAVAGRRRCQAALAGTVILSAAAVYDMDVLNAPEIIGALLIGGAVGLLLGREWPESRLTVLLTIFAGFAGAAMISAAAAAWLNPFAFGLVDEGSADVATRHLLALGAVALAGSGACAAAVVALLRRGGGNMALLAISIGMVGWAAAAFAFLLENMGLAVAGGLGGAAGTGIALRLCGGARGKGLADAEARP